MTIIRTINQLSGKIDSLLRKRFPGYKRLRFHKKLKNALLGYFAPIPRPEKWVFIIGCYNSGTSLLHDIIARHPSVGSMPGEGHYFTSMFRLPLEDGKDRLWALEPEKYNLDPEDSSIDPVKLKKQWANRFNDPHKPVLIEKSPPDAARMLWFDRHFENAHFICIIRNGYAVAEGIHRKAGHDLEDAARQWLVSNQIMLENLQKVKKGLLVKYEDITENPAQTLQEVFAFIGLEMPPGLLEQTFEIHERKSKIKNMNAVSFKNLNAGQIRLIENIAGDLLKSLGYHVTTG